MREVVPTKRIGGRRRNATKTRRGKGAQGSLTLHSRDVTVRSHNCQKRREQVTVNPLLESVFIHRGISGPSAATAVFGPPQKNQNTYPMNMKTIGATALLALAGTMLAPTHSNAALAYNDGDLILGSAARQRVTKSTSAKPRRS